MSQVTNETQGNTDHRGQLTIETADSAFRQPGLLEQFFGVLFSPQETFEKLNMKPVWVAPTVIAMVVSLISGYFVIWRVQPDYDQIVREAIKHQVENNGVQSPPEPTIQRQIELSETIGKFIPIISAVSQPIGFLALAGIFIFGLTLIQAQVTFKKVLSVVAWSGCTTSMVSAAIVIIVLMLKDVSTLKGLNPNAVQDMAMTSLKAVLSSSSPATLQALAASVDFFTLWFLILLTIGFKSVAGSKGITMNKAGAVVFLLWCVWILTNIGKAAIFHV